MPDPLHWTEKDSTRRTALKVMAAIASTGALVLLADQNRNDLAQGLAQSWRLRKEEVLVISLVGDAKTDNLAQLQAALGKYACVCLVPDETGAVVGVSDTLRIPDDKILLVHTNLTLRALATGH